MNEITHIDPTTWDLRFLELAQVVAGWSEDRSRKVGAIIVGPNNETRSIGYNGLPRGIDASVSGRHSRDDGEKYLWFEHAERNAVYNAARAGIAVEGCRMYLNLFPCADCARAIIQSGIRQLNTPEPTNEEGFFRRSSEVALEMLLEARVEVRFIKPVAP